jgi:hypothetical protein
LCTGSIHQLTHITIDSSARFGEHSGWYSETMGVAPRTGNGGVARAVSHNISVTIKRRDLRSDLPSFARANVHKVRLAIIPLELRIPDRKKVRDPR